MPATKRIRQGENQSRQNDIDLLTIGDVSVDLYMKVDEHLVLPAYSKENPQICFLHGSKIPVEVFKTCVAGNASNVAIGCKNLGLSTSIYTEIGDDYNGESFIDEYKKRGINTSFCIKNKGSPTNVHSVIVAGGERTIFAYHERRIYKMQNWTKPKWLYYTSMPESFELFQQELINYLEQNKDVGVAFNPGTMQMKAGLEKIKNFLAITHILFVNKEEATKLVDEAPVEILHKRLQNLGPKLTVITDGKNGSSIYENGTFIKIGILKTKDKIVDITGVGDAYASGFLSAIYYGKTLLDAMKWGTINAYGVTREIGAIHGLYNKIEIEKAYEKFGSKLNPVI